MKPHIYKLLNAIYLALSDCDGMCEHCNERLKRKCIQIWPLNGTRYFMNLIITEMNKLRVLIACEESQIICKAFREKGHEAYSCDIQDCSGGHPEWHIQDDILKHLNDGWDLMIAHPPCTHLAVAGAVHWKKKQSDGRQQSAILFFMEFVNAPILKIAIENPVGIMTKKYKKPDQYIEPFEFGHEYKKKTCLWLKGLPILLPTQIVSPKCYWGQPQGQAYKKGMKLNSCGGHRTSKMRSKTFPGIANAMAEQWGTENLYDNDIVEYELFNNTTQ